MKSSTEKHINVIVHRFEEVDPTPWDLICSFFGVEGRSGPRAYKIYFRNEDLTEVYVFRATRGTSTDTNVHTGKLTEGLKGVIVVVWHSLDCSGSECSSMNSIPNISIGISGPNTQNAASKANTIAINTGIL